MQMWAIMLILFCYNNENGPAGAYNDLNYPNESTKIVYDPRISIAP